MNRKLIAVGLSLALTLTGAPALAASAADGAFPSLNTYPGYADVPAGSWFESSAKICYETGLITGSDRGFEAIDNTFTGLSSADMGSDVISWHKLHL